MKNSYTNLKLFKKGAPFWWIGVLFVLALGGIWYYAAHTSDTGITNNESMASTSDQITNPTKTTGSAAYKPTTNTASKASTVVTITQKVAGASQFISLFKSTGVAAEITGKGPYTIFVPTNGAFSQLPPGTISKMTPEQKLRFVRYHVVSGRALDSQAQVAGTIQALSGDALNFSYGADKIPLVNSAIFIQKYQASNGVVYLIDNVLLPPLRTQ